MSVESLYLDNSPSRLYIVPTQPEPSTFIPPIDLNQRREQKRANSPLAQSVERRVDFAPVQPGEIARRELSGSGFDIDLAQKAAWQDYQELLKDNKTHDQALQTVLARVSEDIRGFYWEYLKKSHLLANPIGFVEVDGERRIGAYGQSLVKVTSLDERLGAPRQAIEQKIEPFLLNAPFGSTSVMVSPIGPSGYSEKHRRTHKRAQVYAYEIVGPDQLRTATFVLDDFDRKASRRLLKELGVRRSLPDLVLDGINWRGELGQVSRLTRQVATLRPNGRLNYSLEYVFDKIRGASSNANSSQFTEIDYQLGRTDELLEIGANYETFITDFENYVRDLPGLDREETWHLVGDKLAEQLARISAALRGGQGGFERAKTMSNEDFKAEGQYIRSKEGCAGGGADLQASETARENMPEYRCLSPEDKKLFCVSCGVCGKEIRKVIRVGDPCPISSCRAIRTCA